MLLEYVGVLEFDFMWLLGKYLVCVYWFVGYGIYCGDLCCVGC